MEINYTNKLQKEGERSNTVSRFFIEINYCIPRGIL